MNPKKEPPPETRNRRQQESLNTDVPRSTATERFRSRPTPQRDSIASKGRQNRYSRNTLDPSRFPHVTAIHKRVGKMVVFWGLNCMIVTKSALKKSLTEPTLLEMSG